jgi:hypothetical protein
MPADGPAELFVGLEGGVGTLALQFDEGLATIDIDLYLGFARSGLLGL